jgi:hypothetical protein
MISSRAWTRPAGYLTRFFVCLLGLGAMAWGFFTLPLFWQQASPRSVAAKILGGEDFKPPVLLAQAQLAEQVAHYRFCNPEGLHSLFAVRLAILNQAIAAANQARVDSSYAPVYETAREVLACKPADSFVWLTLFWLDSGKRGFNERNADYLRLSYTVGRNEGWIALWRVRLAFVLFERLPADLANNALDDFVRLVNTGQFYWQMADNFGHASPIVQNRIVDRLGSASMVARRQFARELHLRGIDVNIPGLERSEARPWR